MPIGDFAKSYFRLLKARPTPLSSEVDWEIYYSAIKENLALAKKLPVKPEQVKVYIAAMDVYAPAVKLRIRAKRRVDKALRKLGVPLD
jgi:hypothetical protein